MKNVENLNDMLNLAVNSVVAGVETRENVVKAVVDYVETQFCEKKVVSEMVSDLIMKLHTFEKAALEDQELNELSETFSIEIHFEDGELSAHPKGGNENGKKENRTRTCA